MNATSCIGQRILLSLVLVACADRRGDAGLGPDPGPVDRASPAASSDDRAQGNAGSARLPPEPVFLFLFGSALLMTGLVRRRFRTHQPQRDDRGSRATAS